MTLQDCINRINGALTDLKQRKAYDIKHPHYNYRGYCFERIAAGVVALGLQDPEDVPCWDYWVARYVPGEFFWKLWEWERNRQGEPSKELEDHLDDALNDCYRTYAGGTVLGQVAALNRSQHESTT